MRYNTTHMNSVRNHFLSGTKGQPTPTVGMGCTILMASDRLAGTIVEVSKSGRTIAMQRDKAELVEGSTMSESQQYEFKPNPDAEKRYFTLRKNGAYVKANEPMRSGTQLRIGDRLEYRDPSF